MAEGTEVSNVYEQRIADGGNAIIEAAKAIERIRILNLIMAEIDRRDPNGSGGLALLDIWHLIQNYP